MSAQIEFGRVIRGQEVRVFASNFQEDPSVGISLGPDEVWAETYEGQPFDLTSKEEEDLGIEATEIFLGREDSLRD